MQSRSPVGLRVCLSITAALTSIDFPAEAQQERQAIAKELFASALGSKVGNPRDQRTWMLLNGLSSHDLSAMRELIGMPQKVLSAARSDNGLFLTVTFQ